MYLGGGKLTLSYIHLRYRENTGYALLPIDSHSHMRDTTVRRLRISKHICLLFAVLDVVVVVVDDDCRQRSPEWI